MAASQFQQLGLLGLLSHKEAGQPLMLALDSIDEDPAQPRKEFDAESLRELADTIALRGVRQPISVRPHPEKAKRWILNFGARRLRASILAGKSEVPAFVDATSDSYDQVIENEQREPLRPMELALFVQRRMQAGDSQAEIARRLGKSRQYITYATALIDPPDWLLAAYREGRCKGATELRIEEALH
jgi:ParB family chromosome partitioning protein